MKRLVLLPLFVFALSGCSTTTVLHGQQAVSGGAAVTTTSSAVSGSASAGSGKVAFSSGSAPAPGTPGGTAVLTNGATAVLVLGIVVVDVVTQFVTSLRGAPAAPQGQAQARSTSIADTCSCYGYVPPERRP